MLVGALKGCLQVLTMLWQTEENADWSKIKKALYISTIKETATTSTSVTSGIAKHLLQPGQSITILNCGTRDTRAQAYTKDGAGVARVLGEDKQPRGSFSDLIVGDLYQPKDGITGAHLRELVQQGLAEFAQAHNPSQGSVAVITGTIRAAWDSASEQDKKVFEAAVTEVLEPLGVKPYGDSYFLPQQSEGKFEYDATCNLVSDVDPDGEVVLSFGIGMGSVQFTTKDSTVPFSNGMKRPDLLTGTSEESLVPTLQESFIGNPAKLQALLLHVNGSKKAILALKSGCLIALLKHPELLQLIVLDSVQ